MAKQGKSYRFRRLRFWAEGGLIHIEDLLTGEYNTATVREFLLRAKAINDDIKRNRWTDERDEHQKFVEEAILACREAKNQGRPDDPKAVADMMRHRRSNSFYQGGVSQTSEAASSDAVPEGAKLPVILGPDGEPFFRPRQQRKLIVP